MSVDLFHNVSTDGGVTWGIPERLTSVQSPNIADAFEFGDYNGLAAVLGQVMAIYTDNRDETGGTAESVDVYAAGMALASWIFGDGFESGDTGEWSSTAP